MAFTTSNIGAVGRGPWQAIKLPAASAPLPSVPRSVAQLLESIPRSTSGDYMTGPPPAFQASLLELQTDIRVQLKRISAALSPARGGYTRPIGPHLPETPPSAETGLSDAKWITAGFQPLNARV